MKKVVDMRFLNNTLYYISLYLNLLMSKCTLFTTKIHTQPLDEWVKEKYFTFRYFMTPNAKYSHKVELCASDLHIFLYKNYVPQAYIYFYIGNNRNTSAQAPTKQFSKSRNTE